MVDFFSGVRLRKKFAHYFFFERGITFGALMCFFIVFLSDVLSNNFGVPYWLFNFLWDGGVSGLQKAEKIYDARYVWCYALNFYVMFPFFVFSVYISFFERLSDYDLKINNPIFLGLKCVFLFAFVGFCFFLYISNAFYYDYGVAKFVYNHYYVFASVRTACLFALGMSSYLVVMCGKIFIVGVKNRW